MTWTSQKYFNYFRVFTANTILQSSRHVGGGEVRIRQVYRHEKEDIVLFGGCALRTVAFCSLTMFL